ncbi:MAG: divalent-cation tolerance protein CutA [Helicobacteraceae bacterium]|jgi:periplasmic divalent cation tolerance protein|nr:divalent-cation tolerance protein CutA [Helicobacteraceae bacterium]
MIALAMTTVGDETAAKKLAAALTQNRLAACVSIAPNISSSYWWNGAIETSAEWLLIIKTAPDKIAAIEALFKLEHPYDLPELIFREFNASADYEAWVKTSVIA